MKFLVITTRNFPIIEIAYPFFEIVALILFMIIVVILKLDLK
jgi:hypothetical protein